MLSSFFLSCTTQHCFWLSVSLKVDPCHLKPVKAARKLNLSQRAQRALDIFYTSGQFTNHCVDTSQHIDRMTSGDGGKIPCVTPKGSCWYMPLMRYITGEATHSSLNRFEKSTPQVFFFLDASNACRHGETYSPICAGAQAGPSPLEHHCHLDSNPKSRVNLVEQPFQHQHEH